MAYDNLDDLADAVDGDKTLRDQLIAVYIGVLAVILAIGGVGGGNATKDATAFNIEASNTWGFFQAKNIRRQELRLAIDALEIRLAGEGKQPTELRAVTVPPDERALIESKLKSYREQEARLASEPSTGEGLKELFLKGKALEVQRDRAMAKDPYFDYGQALLQIAIVLATVAIITGGSALLYLSGIMSALGTLMTLNGFFLIVG